MLCGCADKAVIKGFAADYLIDVVSAAWIAFYKPDLIGIEAVGDTGYIHIEKSFLLFIIYK